MARGMAGSLPIIVRTRYRTEAEKWAAIVEDIITRQKEGRPALVGTVSIEKSERVSGLLQAAMPIPGSVGAAAVRLAAACHAAGGSWAKSTAACCSPSPTCTPGRKSRRSDGASRYATGAGPRAHISLSAAASAWRGIPTA